MGAKNLKAIAFTGTTALNLHPDPELAELIAKLEKAMQSGSTAKYRGPGTVANLAQAECRGRAPGLQLPAVHVRRCGFPERREAGAETEPGVGVGYVHGSGSTSIRQREGETKSRLEYESLFAFGPLCGIDDPDVVIQAAGLCDRLGIDTISAGGTIAWAMESFELGHLHPRRHPRPGACASGAGPSSSLLSNK